MPTMRFNHMELTLPTGTLDTQLRGDITRFYVKYLLPIYFDIQCLTWDAGTAPSKRWTYGC